MISSMRKLKILCKLIAGLFLFIYAGSGLWAYVKEIPADLEEYLENNYERYNLCHYQEDGNGFYFIYVMNEKQRTYFLAAVNPKSPEKSEVLMAYPYADQHDISSMIYNPKNKTFYFNIYNGRMNKYGLQTHDFDGIYKVTRNSEGLYLKRNLYRYSILQDWVLRNVCDTYLMLPDVPDYDAFLNYMFSFADPGIVPVFCVKDKNFNVLTNKEAVEYLIKTDQIKDLQYVRNKYWLFALDKFLYVADEFGNPTEKTAVSYYDSDYCFYGRLDYNFEDMYFALWEDEVYFSVNCGSEKYRRGGNLWSLDWSEVYKLYDTPETGLYITQPEAFSRIHAKLHRTYESNFTPDNREPLEVCDYGLIINDIKGNNVWLYDGQNIQCFDNKDYMMGHLFKQGLKPKNTARFILIINICMSILLIQAIVFLILGIAQKQKRNEKAMAKVRQNERQKISYDIHDSVVQDIRAIRIGTEMLEVKKSFEVKKDNLIADITNCIVKMRDICYGLSPAEFFDMEDSDLVDVYSILQSLGEQFFRRTNIRCSISCDDEEDGFYFCMDDCYNILSIVQEAFKNIEKHSFATSVQIFCRHEIINKKEYMTLFIIDDGKGCDIDQVLQKKNLKNHFGLKMIREHVKMIKGSYVEFFSAPGDGMQIKISLCGVAKKQK